MALLDRARDALNALRGKPPQAPAEKPQSGIEIGFGGAKVVGGVIRDEHVATLAGVAGIQMATKMRRSSAQVRCTERVVGLPIRSAVWLIEEPKDASAAEKEAAELLRENLLGGGMQTAWDAVLREATLAVYYGFRVPEIVWVEERGVLKVRKIASRNPELVEQWLYNPDGSLAGFLYVGNRPAGQGLTNDGGNASTVYERIPVPLEKTLHFAYESENESPVGFGLWRSQYQHWYIVSALYKVLSIGIERNLLDVPVGRLQSGAQADDRRKLLTILSRWRAADDAAVVLTDDQSIEFVGSQRSLMDAMPFLYHHDTKILQAGLAAFLNLGQGEVGTQAVGTTLAKTFEMSVDATAGWIEDEINRQVVRRWAVANYGPDYRERGFRPPRLTHKPIRSNDLAVWSNALTALLGGGLLHATVDDEEYLRDLFELPAISRENLEAAQEERDAQAEEDRNIEQLRLQNDAARQGGGRAEAVAAHEEDEGALEFSEPVERPAHIPEGEKWGAKTTPQPWRPVGKRRHYTEQERKDLMAADKAARQARVQDDGVS